MSVSHTKVFKQIKYNLMLGILLSVGWAPKVCEASRVKVVEIGFDDIGCTDLSCGQLKDFCRSKLEPRAVRECLAEGYSGNVFEIANSFDYDCATGGACQSTSGIYTSFACAALFRCE